MWTLAVCALLATQTSPYRTDPWVDGALIAGSLAGAMAVKLIPPVRTPTTAPLWLPFDRVARVRFSGSGAAASDALLLATILTPVSFHLGRGTGGEFAQAMVVYSETLALTALLSGVTKLWVARPRPYATRDEPSMRAFTRAQGDDAFRSFFSGHAAVSFAAAVSGGLTFHLRSDEVSSRALLFGGGIAMATTTAALRVRAGRHYPTDVLFGAVVGTGVGVLLPWLHARTAIRPTGEEWLAMAGGLSLGLLAGVLLPVRDDVLVDLPLRDAPTPEPSPLEELTFGVGPIGDGVGCQVHGLF